MTAHVSWFPLRLPLEEGNVMPLTIQESSITYPDESLRDAYEPGCTEPWIAELVGALLKANRLTTVLECGGFKGTTSAWLACTLQAMGGGSLTVAEFDPEAPERADWVQERLERLNVPNVDWRVVRDDAIKVIQSFPDNSLGFVFLDDNHEHAHVDEEIRTVLPKLVPGGIVCGHDAFGSCNLQEEFRRYGGYALDLPRLGLAGGLGIIQV